MSPKPMLSVRSPKNVDDFVHGAKSPDQPAVILQQVPAANAADETALNRPAPLPSPGSELVVETAPAPSSHLSTTPLSSARRPKMRGVVKRADGDERARVTVYLELDVAAKLRRHCFENGLELSEIAADAINGFVTTLA